MISLLFAVKSAVRGADPNSGNPSVEIGALDSRFNIYILYHDEKSEKS